MRPGQALIGADGSYPYPDLYGQWHWPLGVHRAPVNYEHPWLCVGPDGTSGHWSRSEAWAAFQKVAP
jgi:hypothetical protein